MTGKYSKEYKTDLAGGLIAVLLIISAWFIGRSIAEEDLGPLVKSAVKGYEIKSVISSTSCIAANKKDSILVAIGTGDGYGGEMKVVVILSPSAYIDKVSIIQNRETASFIKKVERKSFLKQFEGLVCNSELGEQTDAVSGATMTCDGISEAVESASHNIAKEYLGLEVPPPKESKLVAGLREISWLVLIALAYITAGIKWKQKLLRWSVMIISLIIIGFKLNIPLSISLINKGLLGYWPDWHTQLYFYIIIFGLLLLILLTGKNHYCDRICPFGTTQEIIGNISAAKTRSPGKYRRPLLWIQRMLALGVIIIALITRRPGAANYEVFGSMFRLTGNNLQFILLIIVAILSLFIRRPWCGYLCPVRPVNDLVKFFRNDIVARFR